MRFICYTQHYTQIFALTALPSWEFIRQPPKTPKSALRSLDKMLIYLYVNSAFVSVASLDFGVFGGCHHRLRAQKTAIYTIDEIKKPHETLKNVMAKQKENKNSSINIHLRGICDSHALSRLVCAGFFPAIHGYNAYGNYELKRLIYRIVAGYYVFFFK